MVIERPVIEYHNKINAADYTREEIEIIKDHLGKASRLVNGYAASYYGVSNIGSALHRSKYENGGDFPDFLLKRLCLYLARSSEEFILTWSCTYLRRSLVT